MLPQQFLNAWNDSGGGAIVMLANGDRIEYDDPPCYFVNLSQADRLPADERRRAIEEGDRYLRIRRNRRERPEQLRDRLARYKVTPLEADVTQASRALAESRLMLGDHMAGAVWMDIETDDRIPNPFQNKEKLRVLSIAWRGADGRSAYWRIEADTDAAEEKLLRRIAKTLMSGRLVLAWNSDGFEEPVLRARMAYHGIDIDWRRVLLLDYLEVYRRNDRVAGAGGERQSYALDVVARGVLGHGKVPLVDQLRERGIDPGKAGQFAAWSDAPELHEEYNVNDVNLMAEIEAKRGFLGLHLALCRLCHVPPHSGTIYKTVLMDGLMLRRGAAEDNEFHWPTRYRSDTPVDAVTYRGGYVMESRVGLYEGVAVLDYARIYPSIIRACNLSPETYRAKEPSGPHITVTDEDGHVGWWVSNPKGQFPAALESLLNYRGTIDAKRDELDAGDPEWHRLNSLSQASKATINSFYGVLGASYSRYFSHPCARGTTAVARMAISKTHTMAIDRGMEVVAADTDSIFPVCSDEAAGQLQDDVNAAVRGWLADLGVPEDRQGLLVCDHEKTYRRLVLCATKRYAGRYAMVKGKAIGASAKLDVKGLEYIRADNAGVARDLQERSLHMLLDGPSNQADAWEVVQRWREQVLAGKWAGPREDWIIAQTLTKAVDLYVNEPPHVVVAKQLLDHGAEVMPGMKIRYVLVGKGEPLAFEEWTDEPLALEVYWDKRIVSPVATVMAAAWPDRDWSAQMRNPRLAAQASLFDKPAPKQRVRQAVKPMRIRLVAKDDEGGERIEALRAACAAAPGKAPLTIEIVAWGKTVQINTRITVSPIDLGPSLRRLGAELLP